MSVCLCVCGAELSGRSVARCRSVKCAYESCVSMCVCGAELSGRSVARCRSMKCAYESCVSVCVCVVQSSVGGLWPGVGQ